MTELSPEVQVHATCVKVGYQIRFINKFCESTRTNLRRGQGSRAKFDDLFQGLTCWEHPERDWFCLSKCSTVYVSERWGLIYATTAIVLRRLHSEPTLDSAALQKGLQRLILKSCFPSFFKPQFLDMCSWFFIVDCIYYDIIYILYIYHHIMDSWLQSMCRRIASVASSSTRCTREMSRTRFCCRLHRRKLKFEARIGKLCRRCDLSCSNPGICRLVDLSLVQVASPFPRFPRSDRSVARFTPTFCCCSWRRRCWMATCRISRRRHAHFLSKSVGKPNPGRIHVTIGPNS